VWDMTSVECHLWILCGVPMYLQAEVHANMGDVWRSQGPAGWPMARTCYSAALSYSVGGSVSPDLRSSVMVLHQLVLSCMGQASSQPHWDNCSEPPIGSPLWLRCM
jgi:hypothetical protein